MNTDLSDQLTVIIPTFHRAHFLGRLLSYAREVQFPFRILIADSTQKDDLPLNEAWIEVHRASLNIGYLRFSCGLMEKLLLAAQQATTPYCCFWADDDFLLPEGHLSCLAFLNQNPDYGSCMGQTLAVRQNQTAIEAYRVSYPSRDETSAVERVTRWSENFYSNFYAVYREQLLLEMLHATAGASCYEQCRIIPEILMGQMGLLLARQRALDDISIVYQMHSANDSRLTPCVRDDSTFPEDYRRYREAAVQIFSKTAGLSASEANQLIDQSFRNIYRWTGGRGRTLKRLVEQLRRRWKKWQLLLDGQRCVPRFTRVIQERLAIGDSLLKSGSVSAAMKCIRQYPDGLP